VQFPSDLPPFLSRPYLFLFDLIIIGKHADSCSVCSMACLLPSQGRLLFFISSNKKTPLPESQFGLCYRCPIGPRGSAFYGGSPYHYMMTTSDDGVGTWRPILRKVGSVAGPKGASAARHADPLDLQEPVPRQVCLPQEPAAATAAVGSASNSTPSLIIL
jgi:hypothetical protein